MMLRSLREGLRRCAIRVLPRRFLREEKGATAVEFAIVAIPFFAIVGAIIETSLVFLADQILDVATNDAARLIRTGQAQQQSFNATQFKQQVCSRLYILFDCSGVYLDVNTATSFATTLAPPVDKDGNFDASAFGFNAGQASEIVVVRAYYQFPLVFTGFGLNMADLANGKRLLGAVTTFRNEPFPW